MGLNISLYRFLSGVGSGDGDGDGETSGGSIFFTCSCFAGTSRYVP